MLKLKSNLKLLDLRAPKKLSLMILISHDDVVRHDGIHEKRVDLLMSNVMSTLCPTINYSSNSSKIIRFSKFLHWVITYE